MLDLKRDFGAACDDTTPDDSCFAAAMTALGQQGGELRIEGRPLLSQRHSHSFGRKIRIVGEGEIRWATPDAGLHLTMTTLDRPIVEGLSWITSHLAQANALTVTMPYTPSGTHAGPIIQHNIFKGQDEGQHGWASGLRLEKCWNSKVSNNTVKGKTAGALPFVCGVGIELFECMSVELAGNYVWHTDDGIRTAGSGWCEGITVVGGELVGVRRGIVLPAAATIAGGVWINRLHINAYERGVVIHNRRMGWVDDDLIFKCHLSTSYFQAVELLSCTDIKVRSNIFNGYPQAIGGNDLASMAICNGVRMHDNSSRDFTGAGAMAVLYATNTNCNVSGNQRNGAGVAAPVNVGGGSGNVVSD